jgi:hypothetical protein
MIGIVSSGSGMATILKATKGTQTRLSSAAATAMISAPNQLSQPKANSRFWSRSSRLVPGRNWRQCFFTICTAPPAQRERCVLKAR